MDIINKHENVYIGTNAELIQNEPNVSVYKHEQLILKLKQEPNNANLSNIQVDDFGEIKYKDLYITKSDFLQIKKEVDSIEMKTGLLTEEFDIPIVKNETDIWNENVYIGTNAELIQNQPNISLYKHEQLILKLKQEPNNSNLSNIQVNDFGEVKYKNLYTTKSDLVQIKKEVNSIDMKTELLTEECDIPIVKSETDIWDDFEQPCSSQPQKHLKVSEKRANKVKKKKRKYLCPVCDKSFTTSSSRKIHLHFHFGKNCTICHLCGKLFTQQELYLIHKFTHFLKKRREMKIKCCICSKRVLMQSSVATSFMKGIFKCEVCSKTTITDAESDAKKSYRCQICFSYFVRKINLDIHYRKHTGETPFSCKMCSTRFAVESGFISHMKLVHSNNKPFKCEVCLKECATRWQLKSHETVHTGETLFKCEVCLKKFRAKKNLIGHLRIHTGDKPFKCNICLEQFAHKHSLKRHSYSHYGQKPHECQICSKRFIVPSGLNEHLRSHTGEKPYTCEICGRGFAVNKSLKLHHRMHAGEKPFRCQICSKTFTQISTLKTHQKTHGKEKPFKCETCSREFTRKTSLIHHGRIHTGEKPFQCEVCFKQFIKKSQLNSHKRIIHLGENLTSVKLV